MSVVQRVFRYSVAKRAVKRSRVTSGRGINGFYRRQLSGNLLKRTLSHSLCRPLSHSSFRPLSNSFTSYPTQSNDVGGVGGSPKQQVDKWLETRKLGELKAKFNPVVVGDIIMLAQTGDGDDIKSILKDDCGLSKSKSILMAQWFLSTFNKTRSYPQYDAKSMGSFFQIWVPEQPSNEPGKKVTPSRTREEFLTDVCEDPETEVLIESIASRKKYVEQLYGPAFAFGENLEPNQVLSNLHVGPPGVGKTVVTKQALKHIPRAFPGMAAAFVELRALQGSGFERPPMPQEIFDMANEESGGKVKKLFVFYDDFEVCYDKPYGEDLTGNVYVAANKNVDIMCHVLGSSQWLGELVHRRLPVLSMMPTLFATDSSKRFEYYGNCTTISESRMREFGVHCDPVMKRDEFRLLVVHTCQQHGVEIELSDEVLNVIQWMASGNARACQSLVMGMKTRELGAFANELIRELDRCYYGMTNEGKEIFYRVLSKLMEKNVRGQYLAPYGQDENGLDRYIATKDPFALQSVSRYELYFTDAGENQAGIIKRMIETGILSQDSNENVYPGKLAYLPMHAISETKATREETAKQLKKAGKWFAEKVVDAVVPTLM